MVSALRMGLLPLAFMASQAATAPAAAPPAVPLASLTPAPMSLAALKLLEAGLWQLEVPGRSPKPMCITDPIALIQIEHDQPGCSRFVIANDPKMSTVHYSCERAGWGRTTVRVENSGTATIRTQGISHNAPFDYAVQAHRLGACGAQMGLKPR